MEGNVAFVMIMFFVLMAFLVYILWDKTKHMFTRSDSGGIGNSIMYLVVLIFASGLVVFLTSLNQFNSVSLTITKMFYIVPIVIVLYLTKKINLKGDVLNTIMQAVIYTFYITHLYTFFVVVYFVNLFMKKKTKIDYFYSIENIAIVSLVWTLGSIFKLESLVSFVITMILVLVSMFIQYKGIYRYSRQMNGYQVLFIQSDDDDYIQKYDEDLEDDFEEKVEDDKLAAPDTKSGVF